MLKLSKIAPLPDWSRKFADPIPVQNRKPLATLRDAAQILSPRCRWPDQQALAWQTAAELLMLIAERGGDLMMARIAVMRGAASA